MKTRTLGVVVLAVMFVLVLTAWNVFAAGTATVRATATINGTCQVTSASPIALAFGTLDQTTNNNYSAAASINFWCTKGTSYTLTDNAVRTMTNGTDNITFTLAYTGATGSGAGKTAGLSSAVTGTVLNANFVNVSAGAYQGDVVFTLAP